MRYLVTLVMLVFATPSLQAQVFDGLPQDSIVYDFAVDTSLQKVQHFYIDTTGARLWRFGRTLKLGFISGAAYLKGIMTDTLNPYPVNQNDTFVVRMKPGGFNRILSFEHRYQTASGRDGGIVEFSLDTGRRWVNALGHCYSSTHSNVTNTLRTENFYGKTDTLRNGTPAFTGGSAWRRSRIQFFQYIPIKATDTTVPCNFTNYNRDVLVRFRFYSDSTQDTLAGWAIRRIALELDRYNSSISDPASSHRRIGVYPNPLTNNLLQLPQLEGAQNIEIADATGRRVFRGDYSSAIRLPVLAPGIYFLHAWEASGHAYDRLVVAD